MGIAYYANYLVWFEVARTEFLREHGLPYRELEESGIYLPVGEAGARMMRPAFYDDELQVSCWIGELRSRSIRLEYEIARPENGTGVVIIATGFTTLVSTSRDRRPQSFSPELRKRLENLGPRP